MPDTTKPSPPDTELAAARAANIEKLEKAVTNASAHRKWTTSVMEEKHRQYKVAAALDILALKIELAACDRLLAAQKGGE